MSLAVAFSLLVFSTAGLVCLLGTASAAEYAPPRVLPTYRPGSFLYAFEISGNSYETQTLSVVNAAGQNFTTVLGRNVSVTTLILYPTAPRLAIVELDGPVHQFRAYQYAPDTAPTLAWPWCTVDENAAPLNFPFLLNGQMFAFAYGGSLIYRVTMPDKDGDYCQATPTNLTVPISSFDIETTSLGQWNELTFITSRAVLVLSASAPSAGSVPFIVAYDTHNLMPPNRPAEYIFIDRDVISGLFYVTLQGVAPANATAFVGTLSVSSGAIHWQPLLTFPISITASTRLFVDPRYYAEVGGPLLCGTNTEQQICVSPTNGSHVLWTGPPFPMQGAGYGPEPTYDPFCG